MTYKNLPQHYLTAQLYLKLLLISEHEAPFMNTSKVTKMVEWPNRDRKCTNITNRRSRVGQSSPILRRWFASRWLLIAWHRCGRWYVIVTLRHSYVEAQEINANRVLRRRDPHSAAHKTGCQQSAGTTNYVISAKLAPSFRRHSLKDFEQSKSGFTFLFVKFLLSFHNKDIISYKILQKIFLLHRHFNLTIK